MLLKEQLANGCKEQEYIQKIVNETYKKYAPPVGHLVNITKTTPSKYWIYYDNKKLIGGLFEYWDEQFTYITYLSIHSHLKNKRYEEQIMDIVQRENKEKPIVVCIFVPIEGSETYENDKERYDFYIKAGFKDTGIVFENPKHNLTVLIAGSLLNPDYIIKRIKKVWLKCSWTIHSKYHNWIWFKRHIKIKKNI